nr:putative mitochondrial protein [Tanacetum cinerariifolium]
MSRIREQAILRVRSIPNQRAKKGPMITKETWEEDIVREKVIIHNDHLDQHVLINKKISVGCKQKLEETLQRNADVLAWAATITHGLPIQVLPTASQGTHPSVDQKGQNVRVYLEEIVVKSKTEESLIEYVKETLDKLRRVNVKIDPRKCTFGMKEGNFLGYVVTTEGIKVNPKKVKVILRGPTPRGPDEIQTLSLQLASISRFTPRMAKLMLPIRSV